MDNKLSELSKPKAFVVTSGTLYQDRAFTDKSTAERSKADRNDGAVVEPLYSQEYVSALLAELEAKDKRIAELEAVKADASQVFKEIGNELGCNPDNESIMMAIDTLKERLATPVRLPNKNDDEFWFDSVFQVAKFDRAVERAISAAGFKFVGDEQS
ncbi:hypothetical protein I5M99_18520 [Serratia marcescens]|nr:hypothetical protein [Serratia marcescens]